MGFCETQQTVSFQRWRHPCLALASFWFWSEYHVLARFPAFGHIFCNVADALTLDYCQGYLCISGLSCYSTDSAGKGIIWSVYNPQTFTQSVSAQCGIFFWVIFRERLFLGHFPGWRVDFVETGRQLTWQLWPSHDKPSFCSAISKNQRLMTFNRNLIEIQNSAQGTKKPLNL